MAQPVGSWPGKPAGAGDGHLPPADLYRLAVEEYRFQARFNWSRTQYLLVFSAGILAAASALVGRSTWGAAVVFVLGAVAAAGSLIVVRTQHGYYRAARDRMRRIEAFVKVPDDLRTNTTTALGGPKRLLSVDQIVYLLFVAIVAADVIGAILVLAP